MDAPTSLQGPPKPAAVRGLPRRSVFREDCDAPSIPPAFTDRDLESQEAAARAQVARVARQGRALGSRALLGRTYTVDNTTASTKLSHPTRALSFLSRQPPSDPTPRQPRAQRPVAAPDQIAPRKTFGPGALGRSVSLFRRHPPPAAPAHSPDPDIRPVYWDPARNRRAASVSAGPGAGPRRGHRAQQESVASTASRFSFSSEESGGGGDAWVRRQSVPVQLGGEEAWRQGKGVVQRVKNAVARRWEMVRELRWRVGGPSTAGLTRDEGSPAAPLSEIDDSKRQPWQGRRALDGGGLCRRPNRLVRRAVGVKRSATVRSDSAVDLLVERKRRSVDKVNETGFEGDAAALEGRWTRNSAGPYFG